MKQTITQFTFAQAFKNMGREDQFTLGALNALFADYEQYEEDSGEQIELDVIAICCDYSEHDDAESCLMDLGWSPQEDPLGYLQENTQVIEFNGGILVASF